MKDGQTIGQWLNWDFETNGDLKIFNRNNNKFYYENSDGYWKKWEYDSQGYLIYAENPSGIIIDNRPPEVIEHNGHKYQLMS